MTDSLVPPFPYTDITTDNEKFYPLFMDVIKSAVSTGYDVFDELVKNKRFIAEAKEARKRIRKNPSAFTNFTKKFSKFID